VLGEVGHREPDQIARWFGDRNAFPLIILQTAERVGFAMVARSSHPPGPPVLSTAWRSFSSPRQPAPGFGKDGRQSHPDTFRGPLGNHRVPAAIPVAVSFWRRVVAGYTRGSYQERVINERGRQVFDSRIERSR